MQTHRHGILRPEAPSRSSFHQPRASRGFTAPAPTPNPRKRAAPVCLTNHEHHGPHRASPGSSTHGSAQRHKSGVHHRYATGSINSSSAVLSDEHAHRPMRAAALGYGVGWHSHRRECSNGSRHCGIRRVASGHSRPFGWDMSTNASSTSGVRSPASAALVEAVGVEGTSCDAQLDKCAELLTVGR